MLVLFGFLKFFYFSCDDRRIDILAIRHFSYGSLAASIDVFGRLILDIIVQKRRRLFLFLSIFERGVFSYFSFFWWTISRIEFSLWKIFRIGFLHFWTSEIFLIVLHLLKIEKRCSFWLANLIKIFRLSQVNIKSRRSWHFFSRFAVGLHNIDRKIVIIVLLFSPSWWVRLIGTFNISILISDAIWHFIIT